MQGSPYKNLDSKNFYIGYPHDALPALTKWYCESPARSERSWELTSVPLQISFRLPVP